MLQPYLPHLIDMIAIHYLLYRGRRGPKEVEKWPFFTKIAIFEAVTHFERRSPSACFIHQSQFYLAHEWYIPYIVIA